MFAAEREKDGANVPVPRATRAHSSLPNQPTQRRKFVKTLRVSFTCGLLLTVFSIASIAQSVQTDYDHSFNLAKLRTYGFYKQERRGGDPLAGSPLNDRRINDALDSQLRANGFANSSSKPDFMIAYFVNIRAGLDIQDNRFGWLQRTGSLNVNQTTEGTIVVVFVDNSTQQEIWRGFVSGTINAKNLNKDVNKGITKLVQKFVK